MDCEVADGSVVEILISCYGGKENVNELGHANKKSQRTMIPRRKQICT